MTPIKGVADMGLVPRSGGLGVFIGARAKPHPPILIGGEGERKTLKFVALYGDACNLSMGTPLEGFSTGLRDCYLQEF